MKMRFEARFLSLLATSRLDRSFAKKNFKKNLWNQGSDTTTSELNLSLMLLKITRAHLFCEDVGEIYTIFTIRFSFWTLFDRQLMNLIRKYVLLFILDF